MTREEEIKQVANACFEDVEYYFSFITGAEWADEHPDLSSLWHDSSEEPEPITMQIIYYSESLDYCCIDYPNYLIIKYGGAEMTWETSVLRNRITKWAYVSDILPKGGER